jgi:hypothetical protein
LVLHVPEADGAGELDQPVGQGGLAMVDMGDDGEIADFGKISHLRGVLPEAPPPSNSVFSGYNRPMLHYLYLDYGGLPRYRRELKYSLILPPPGAGGGAGGPDRGLYRRAHGL